MARFTPSDFQIDIFNAYNSTRKNLVIQAVPGSGKTTTILQLTKFLKPYKKSVFLAFNGSTVDNLKDKLPNNSNVMTLHSLGCKAIYRHFNGKVEKNDFKIFRIAKQISSGWKIPPKKIDYYIFNIVKIVTLFRLRGETSFDSIQNIIDYHDIDTLGDEIEHTIQTINAMHRYNNSMSRNSRGKFEIDFCDMVWYPVINDKIKLDEYDEVFVDEIQDLNVIQQKLIDKIIKPGGRFVAVGDPRQSIYGFLASDINSYNNFREKENTIELPLSYCYRSGTEIVKKVNTVYDVVKSPPGKEDGEVIDDGDFKDIKEGDFVLCRNNAPLVELYFEFISQEKPCYIKGVEIGRSLINTIKEFGGETKQQTLSGLEGKLAQIYSELRTKGIKKPKNHPKYYNFYEKILIFKVIAKNYDTMHEIYDVIKRMFSDISKGIALMTIHKSKGLESDNVYLYKESLIPSEYATQDWQIEQEENLRYVAFSRAKNKLILVN